MAKAYRGIKVKTASVIELREAVIKYRDENAILRKKVENLTESVADIRMRRDRRYGKLSWRHFKEEQKVYAIRLSRDKKWEEVKKRMAKNKKDANITAKERWFERGVEKGRIKGIRIGKKTHALEVYHNGVRSGIKIIKNAEAKRYDFRRKAMYKIESVSRLSIIVARLGKALGLNHNDVSYLLWCGQHEHWTKKNIDAAFSDIKFDNYYRCLYKLKSMGIIEPIASNGSTKVWHFTYKGQLLSDKMQKYISKYFNEKLNK